MSLLKVLCDIADCLEIVNLHIEGHDTCYLEAEDREAKERERWWREDRQRRKRNQARKCR